MAMTLQSMAAACLSRAFPRLASQGVFPRNRAIEEIKREMRLEKSFTIAFLCSIILGHSANWHADSDLGLPLYRSAKRLAETACVTTSQESTISDQRRSIFFDQAMMYWRTILSFVSDDAYIHERTLRSSESLLQVQSAPHPWALIATEMMDAIPEVGATIHAHRQKHGHLCVWKRLHIEDIQKAMSTCERLEHTLIHWALLAEHEILDPGTSSTPISHFLAVSQAYRLTGLIQIYRTFPDIHLSRLKSGESVPAFEEVTLPTADDADNIPDWMPNQWLRELSMYVVDVLMAVPFESYTRSIQAFLYVALSSEMKHAN
ncbi:uncharacterized protein A1O9_04779 [Exophiala aquamarina CBS 119918]|uniref:Transcription factor domain-containing protein n=1 Tax=Exophiala aquamarina CBS 119918 TaxID=1182545 RepID=A0A072PJ66_9EURO|nr:uncharacterized protein A1O9_04779 [Exophiala aquamarina CBS 119918]KEF59931.1 hypothetical protein A1O9_04779 [Exophiala aquamarina CBS 119918]